MALNPSPFIVRVEEIPADLRVLGRGQVCGGNLDDCREWACRR
jgi:hypothetical protein